MPRLKTCAARCSRGVLACRRVVDLARVRGGEPEKPSGGDAEPAISPFGAVRPNASLSRCESWRGHGCASGFMAATVRRKQFPRRYAASSRSKFFSPPGSPLRCDRKRCSPLDFIARLAALVPKPRVNLIRFHGVFAPNSRYRGQVTKAKRGRGGRRATTADMEEPTPAERRASMTWAQRLKRAFGIDIETCPACGGAVRIIACIEDPEVIAKILSHLDAKAGRAEAARRPPCRAPPRTRLFDCESDYSELF